MISVPTLLLSLHSIQFLVDVTDFFDTAKKWKKAYKVVASPESRYKKHNVNVLGLYLHQEKF